MRIQWACVLFYLVQTPYTLTYLSHKLSCRCNEFESVRSMFMCYTMHIYQHNATTRYHIFWTSNQVLNSGITMFLQCLIIRLVKKNINDKFSSLFFCLFTQFFNLLNVTVTQTKYNCYAKKQFLTFKCYCYAN